MQGVRIGSVLTSLALAMIPAQVFGVEASPAEMSWCGQWVDSVFGLKPPGDRSYLQIVYEDVGEAVTRGQSWRGGPYRLGDRTFSHGIGFNSTKHIRIHLEKPTKRFTAVVGLENNDDTQRGAAIGQGSVTFHVLIADKEVVAAPVMRLRDAPVEIDVPLNGADEFEIRVGDGGDGRGWDQALWAEAIVRLQDGSVVRLQDLPWSGRAATNAYGFDFVFDGTPGATMLGNWGRKASEELTEGRTHRTIMYAEPNQHLTVRVEIEVFEDFPAVEWVAYLSNPSQGDTPIISDILACDTDLDIPSTGAPILHWSKGAVASFDDFAPQTKRLDRDTPFSLQPGGGRSSSQVLPFFNLEGAGTGVIAVIGWSGEWRAAFQGTSAGGALVQTGLARTHLRLRPNEEIRTPRMLLLFYQGDHWHGQNLLREFILEHHRPKRNGEPLVAPITNGNWGATRAEIHLDNVRKIIRHELPIEYYWIDAEWFGPPGGSWPVNVGFWEVKKDLYPEGFKPISALLRQSGRELQLWFEPERVFKGTPWHRDHHDWLLDTGGDSCLWN
ncbi:MAG: NPCBM/NEW2 domain-containing protein, partial [Candidatus Hydrogenedentes bacterium]|nr:NPCBM/NEW2 domain-containing protein [Candidatus Hydrogenedentota bacterium]